LQTPQGLDATHSDELFPVKRVHWHKLRSAKGFLRWSKILALHVATARHF
jgi:hypothetical protein